MWFWILFLFIVMVSPILSARILGIVPAPSYSHQIVFQPLWEELSLRGHQVTVLTTNPVNNPSLINLTEINLNFSHTKWNELNINEMAEVSTMELYKTVIQLGYDTLDSQLQHSEVQKIIHSNSNHFDVVLVETVFPAMIAFSKKLKCPLIQILTMDAATLAYHTIGNPSHPATNPDFLLPFTGRLNFFQRLISTAYLLLTYYIHNLYIGPLQNLLVEKHFSNNYPPLREISKTTSIMFVNVENVFHVSRPLLPSVQQFGGGIHIKPAQPLPKDLQNHLDNATNGAIYFSLGSMIKSQLLSEKKKKVLLDTFAELPYKVLWKFEQDDLPGKPENVIIYKWFPQQDVFKYFYDSCDCFMDHLAHNPNKSFSHTLDLNTNTNTLNASLNASLTLGHSKGRFLYFDIEFLRPSARRFINKSAYGTRHPNIKLVVTQGGLQSTEEAIYNHIPIVGIPLIGDQHHNIYRLVERGLGLVVEYTNLNKAALKSAILEVINNPVYRNRVKELANLARDQPMTSLEQTVWWTEYVIRHKGTRHFRSPALDLNLYQHFCFDVITFCVTVLVASFYILFKSFKLSLIVIRRFST